MSEASKLNAHISLARQLFSATQAPNPDEERVVITSKMTRPEIHYATQHQQVHQHHFVATPEKQAVPNHPAATPQRAQSPPVVMTVDLSQPIRNTPSGMTSPKFPNVEESRGVADVSRSKSPGSQLGKGNYRSLLGNSNGLRGTPTMPIRQQDEHNRCPSSDTRAAVNSQHIQ